MQVERNALLTSYSELENSYKTALEQNEKLQDKVKKATEAKDKAALKQRQQQKDFDADQQKLQKKIGEIQQENKQLNQQIIVLKDQVANQARSGSARLT
jgi:predicted  nucleic acid-binding Zn-ribbon protein